MSDYEEVLGEIEAEVSGLITDIADAQSAYDSAAEAQDYIAVKRLLIEILLDIADQQDALFDLSSGLATVEGSDDLLTSINALDVELATAETDAKTLMDSVDAALASTSTACTSDSDCSGYRCNARGYCVFSCTSDMQCYALGGYSCDPSTET